MELPSIIVDNFLSDDECNVLMDVMVLEADRMVAPNALQQRGKSFYWYDIDQEAFQKYRYYKLANHIVSKLNRRVPNLINRDVEIDWINFAVFDEGTHHPKHVDGASDRTVYTTVLYLNDNFTGGMTYFDDGTMVAPKPGRLFGFDGDRIPHGVTPVDKGTRYSLAAWWKEK